MLRLTPEAQELVRAGRAAFRPGVADRERVYQALTQQLGGSLAAEGANGPSYASPAAKATLWKTFVVLGGLGIAGGGLLLALRSEPPTSRTAAVVHAKTPPATPAPTAIEGAPEIVTSAVPPQAHSAEKRTSIAPRQSDSLAQEVAILSRAGAELHAGRPAAALSELAEHQRKFPSGMLTQERSAARVQALCALGRTKEAKAELARLARTSPNSPHEARARKACGSVLSE